MMIFQPLILKSFTLSAFPLRAIPFPSWLHDTAIDLPGPLAIKWYGIAYIVSLFGAYFYARRSCANRALWQAENPVGEAIVPDKRMLEDLLFFSFLGIILGGRIGYILLYGLDKYLAHPLDIFKVWEGGMSFHGGFAGVCLAALYMAKTRKIRLMRIADILAISAPIGLFLVRLANFVNQELYGRETDVPWAVIFKPGGRLLAPRHPSQLYEAFLEGIVIFSVLFIASRKGKILTKPGQATGLFMLMYGTFRFLIEFVREPDAIAQFDPLTRGQVYSLPMIVFGVIVLVWARRQKPVAPRWPESEAGSDADA